MSEWRPIEEAPKDTPNDFILWNGVRVFFGWCDDENRWRDSANQDHNDYLEVPQPTHWMPLPQPPIGE